MVKELQAYERIGLWALLPRFPPACSLCCDVGRWFKTLEDEYHPPLVNPPMDIEGYCASNAKHQGWLAPWRED